MPAFRSLRQAVPLIPAMLVPALLAAAPQPRAFAGDGDAVATVNGDSIARADLVNVLLEARGLEIMQQLIVLQLARQESRRAGVSVGDADIQAEYRSALDSIAQNAGLSGEDASEANKRAALENVLKEKHISMAEFMIGMERNAHLRKVVERSFKVDEPTLREEFARTCGERVVVRHIQIAASDRATLAEVQRQLAAGADFAAVAAQLSQNPETAPRGGLMEPFTFVDPYDPPRIPAAMRELAFSLKADEVSNPLRLDQMIHVLKLDHRIAPENARFEDVRGEVERKLRERVLPQQMEKLAIDLFQKASVRVLDSSLREKYEKFMSARAKPSP